MRKIVFILFIATALFFMNLVFYILSEDYRFFVKKIKYSDTVVYESDAEVNDDNKTVVVLPAGIKPERNDSTSTIGREEIVITDDSFQFLEPIIKEDVELAVMTTVEKGILKLFSSFELKPLEKHASLFDITTEYPDEYFEYYSKDLVVYFFSTKSYSEVYDIFDILSDELPYDLNEINNFGQSSFFINLKEVYTDEFVRVVIQYKNKAFGLKINKDRYNDVKNILIPLKPQK